MRLFATEEIADECVSLPRAIGKFALSIVWRRVDQKKVADTAAYKNQNKKRNFVYYLNSRPTINF